MRADQFLYVFYVLQYVNGHADNLSIFSLKQYHKHLSKYYLFETIPLTTYLGDQIFSSMSFTLVIKISGLIFLKMIKYNQ